MTRRSVIPFFLGAKTFPQVLHFDQPLERRIPSKSDNATSSGDQLVRWTPRRPFNGAPILFQSKTYSGAASWLDKKIEFRRDGDGFSAIAGVNLNRSPGRYSLVLGSQTIEVAVARRSYRASTITVPPRFLKPPKDVESRIAEEAQIKKKVFQTSPPERLWQGRFVAPAKTRFTSSFGTRRVYNGQTRSVHQGLDYSAAIGTEIYAANSGRVVIARHFYFEGGLVAIDHGESIFTLYMHLSEFLVQEGSLVEKRQPIAKSGASGRVTGPHLHFAIQWQGAYLEPLTLLRLWQA